MDLSSFLAAIILLAFYIFIFSIILLLCCIRKAPAGKVIIIDRKGHYLKTVKYGRPYFFFSITDKITTEISTKPCSKRYSEIFETYDSELVRISYNVVYKSDDIEKTLKALEESRRSIDDVLNCAVYNVVSNMNYNDPTSRTQTLEQLIQKAKFDANSLNFTLLDIGSFSIESVSENERKNKFKPHISSSAGPIKYN